MKIKLELYSNRGVQAPILFRSGDLALCQPNLLMKPPNVH